MRRSFSDICGLEMSSMALIELNSSVREKASSITTSRKLGASAGAVERPYSAERADARIVKASLAFCPPDLPVVEAK